MASVEASRKRWYHQPHSSSWYALIAIIVGILAVNMCCHPFVTVAHAAAIYYGVTDAGIRWISYACAAVSIPAILLVLPATRKHGIHIVVYAASGLLLSGVMLRCFAMAWPLAENSTRPVVSYIIVYAGNIIASLSFAPFLIAGTLVSTSFPREGRVFVHTMVSIATPIGMLLGCLVPAALGIDPMEAKPRDLDMVLVVLAAIAFVAFLVCVHLMRTATAQMRATFAAARDPEMQPPTTPNSTVDDNIRSEPGDQVEQQMVVDEADDGDGKGDDESDHRIDEVDKSEATDVLPQVVKLACTAEFMAVAVAFSFSVAPFFILFVAETLYAGPDGFVGSASDGYMILVVLLALLLLPSLLHLYYHIRRVRHLDVILPQILLLASTIFFVNLVPNVFDMHGVLSHAFIITGALLAVVLIPLLLERSVSVTKRSRPAVAAGVMWLGVFCTTVLLAILSEFVWMRCDGKHVHEISDVDEGCAYHKGKWLLVACAVVAVFASVFAFWLSTRDQSNGLSGSVDPIHNKSYHDVNMHEVGPDALHPDNLPHSFTRPVWWQNPTAEDEAGLRDAIRQLKASGFPGKNTDIENSDDIYEPQAPQVASRA